MEKNDQKLAIVTGATGGIGFEVAKKLGADGFKVILNGIHDDEGRKRVSELIDLKIDAEYCGFDVTNEEMVNKNINEIGLKYGKIDVLVNNAGIAIIKPLEETSEEEWDKTINVNLKSVFLGCKTFLPDMREQKNGSIINISSIAGLVGLSNCSAYNASKGGVRLLTKNIAVEYGEFNVRCNSIHPGFMATNMNDPKVVAERGRDINALTDAIPLKRMGTAEDIANCALFLASDESVYVTGSEYTVDAGLTAR